MTFGCKGAIKPPSPLIRKDKRSEAANTPTRLLKTLRSANGAQPGQRDFLDFRSFVRCGCDKNASATMRPLSFRQSPELSSAGALIRSQGASLKATAKKKFKKQNCNDTKLGRIKPGHRMSFRPFVRPLPVGGDPRPDRWQSREGVIQMS